MTTTHTGTPEDQVLVVGAGPTGLTLAAQLLARGIHARVIDKGAGPASQSRALSIQARTLELLDAMGLADAFVDHGHRVRRLRWYAGQRNLCDLDLARNGSRYGFVLDLPQSRTETLLRARVQELGGTIEQRVELVRLAERGGAVDATLRDAAGQEIEVSAGYVVGCDGAHSRPARCPSSRSPTRGARWSSPTVTAAGRSPATGSPTSTSVASTDRPGCITCSAADATC